MGILMLIQSGICSDGHVVICVRRCGNSNPVNRVSILVGNRVGSGTTKSVLSLINLDRVLDLLHLLFNWNTIIRGDNWNGKVFPDSCLARVNHSHCEGELWGP